jgi:hypothetical protein
MELERTWDELINFALNKLADDIEAVRKLRKKVKAKDISPTEEF